MPPVGAFLGGISSFIATGAVAGAGVAGAWAVGTHLAAWATSSLVGKLLTSVAMSALMQALGPKPPNGGGIAISTTLRGEQNPETILFGITATGGQAICPPYSHGKSNAYLTHVIELCSVPGATLSRLILGDEYVELGTTLDPDYGQPVLGEKYEGLVWIRYYDGTQTVADPMLRAKYGDHPDRPWTANMIGNGLCYAILTFRGHKERLTQVPRYRFEMQGVPLYDPRKDSTAGGSGAHRWANPTTWEQTTNPAVIAYNIKRGITLPGGEVWGGKIAAADLPNAPWFAAMNACAATINTSKGPRPRYRCGIEAALSQEPAAILVEILKAASAQVADVAGVWKILVGAPSLPVYSLTDADVLVSRPQELDPFPSLSETYNAVAAQYPSPADLWEPKDAPLRTNAEWEAADVFGRRTAELSLPAVPFEDQVQWLTRAWLEGERRFRRHMLPLPPDAAILEPLDTADFSSARNGYINKDFQVGEVVDEIMTCVQQVSMREVDNADYDWSPAFELPTSPMTPGTTLPLPEPVSGFDAIPVALMDADGVPRRAGIRLSWDEDIIADGLRWEMRLSGTTAIVIQGTTMDIDAGTYTASNGIIPATAYDVRARLIAGRRTDWAAWKSVITHDLRFGAEDIADTVFDTVTEIANEAGVTTVTALPAAGTKDGQIVMVMPEGVLWRWDEAGGVWSRNLYAGIKPGDVDITKFASGIEPVGISTAGVLPTVKTTTTIVWQGKIYRWSGTAYVASVPTVDLVGTVSGAQIAAGAIDTAKFAAGLEPVGVSTAGSLPTVKTTNTLVWSGKLYRWNGTAYVASVPTTDLTGTIAGAQLAPGAVDAAKFASGIEPVGISTAGTLPTVKSTSTLLWQNKIYRWNGTVYVASVPTSDLSGQVIDTQIAAGAVKAGQLDANAVVAGKIAAGAVSASEIAAGSITAAALRIGDLSNLATEFVSPNPLAPLLPPGWGGNTPIAYAQDLTIGDASGWVAEFEKQRDFLSSPYFAVTPGEQFYVSVWAFHPADGSTYVFGPMLNVDRHTGGQTWVRNGSSTVRGAFTRIETLITVPANAYRARLLLQAERTHNAVGNANMKWSKPVVRKATGAVMIENGAIISDKIATGAIVAGKIAAGAVTAGTIAANAVTAATIVAGAVSANQLAAGAILASKIAISDFANLYPDFDCADESFYSTDTAADYGFFSSGNANMGRRGVRIFASAALERVATGWFNVDAGADYLVSSVAFLSADSVGAGAIAVRLRLGSVDAAGAITPTRLLTVGAQTDGSSQVPHKLQILTEAGERVAQFEVTRSWGGTAEARFGALRVTRMAGGELIVDGQVTAAKVAANAVTADKIAANAVTAGKIAANAVTANTIEANAVTVGKVAAGAIRATEIAADAITASKMAITNVTNLYLDYDCVDPDYLSGTFTRPDGSAIGLVGRRFIRIAADTATQSVTSKWIEVEPGAEYIAWAAAALTDEDGGNGTVQLQTGSVDVDGVVTLVRTITIKAFNTAVWQDYSEVALMAATERRARFRYVRVGDTNASAARFGAPRLHRRSDASLIVDGAIKANKIESGAVETDKIAAGAIVASKIAAGQIAATHLAATNVISQTAQIADALISSAKIIDAAITAAKIGTAAITTAKIGDLQVDTIKIAGNAVSTMDHANTAGSISVVAGAGSFVTVQTLTLTKGRAQPVLLDVQCNLLKSGTGTGTIYARIMRGGTELRSVQIYYADGFQGPDAAVGSYKLVLPVADTSTATGSVTYSLQIGTVLGGCTAEARFIGTLNAVK